MIRHDSYAGTPAHDPRSSLAPPARDNNEMFGHNNDVTAEAVIIEDHIAHHSGGSGQGNLHEWVADVRPPTGEAFRTTIPTPGFSTDFRHPDVGDVVSVVIDHHGKVRFDKSDPRLSLRADRARREARHGHVAAASPSLAAPGRETTDHASTSVAARLAQLQQLHADGALTQEEYTAQRQRIIESI
jgi:Short C-terminal domain